MANPRDNYIETHFPELENLHRRFLQTEIDPLERYDIIVVERNNGRVRVREYSNWLGFDVHYLMKYTLNGGRIADLRRIQM